MPGNHTSHNQCSWVARLLFTTVPDYCTDIDTVLSRKTNQFIGVEFDFLYFYISSVSQFILFSYVNLSLCIIYPYCLFACLCLTARLRRPLVSIVCSLIIFLNHVFQQVTVLWFVTQMETLPCLFMSCVYSTLKYLRWTSLRNDPKLYTQLVKKTKSLCLYPLDSNKCKGLKLIG